MLQTIRKALAFFKLYRLCAEPRQLLDQPNDSA